MSKPTSEEKGERHISLYEKKEEYECVLQIPRGLIPAAAAASVVAASCSSGSATAGSGEGDEKISREEVVAARQEEMTLSFIDQAWLKGGAVVIHKCFSPSECQVMMDYCEGKRTPESDLPKALREEEHRVGLMVPAAKSKNHRNNLRVVSMGEDIAALLFQRITPFLQQIGQETIIIDNSNYHYYEDQAFGIKGTWRACGINPCFRICKYNPDGHFAPHCDSNFMKDFHNRSLKTFMIYLNDDYEAGTTNFLEEHSLYFDEGTKRYKAPRDSIKARLKAQQGDVLLFDHNILHEGETVSKGVKYIMRAEVMYQRQGIVDHENLGEDATEEEKKQAADALRLEKGYILLREARALEAGKDFDGAVSKYRAAFKIAPELERAE